LGQFFFDNNLRTFRRIIYSVVKKSLAFIFTLLINLSFSQKLFLDYKDSIIKNTQNYPNKTIDLVIRKWNINKNEVPLGICFQNSVNFKKSTFHDSTDFSNAIFLSNADFSGAIFKKNSEFKSVIFKKPANFLFSRFLDSVGFSSTHFIDSAIFTSSSFYDQVYFDGCRFEKTLMFKDVNTFPQTRFHFDNAVLPDTIYFAYNPSVSNIVDLSLANFLDSIKILKKGDKPILISFYKSDISKFRLDYYHFKLLLIHPKTHHPLPSDEVKTIYEGLLKNFKDNGQMDSYELLDIEYHDYVNGYFSIPHFWNCYGYHKEWIFIWIILFISVFTVLTFRNLDVLMNTVYKIEAIPDPKPLREIKRIVPSNHKQMKHKRKLLNERWWYSLIYTSSIFFLLSLKFDHIKFNNRSGLLYILLLYSLGILSLGYVANFIFQK
jgi:hypothetical protein